MGTTGAQPACEEKTLLSRVYSFAASDYGRAVMVLHERVGKLTKRDYEDIRSFSDKARETAEQARAALDKHTAEHGC
jgi:hypothetical protein